MAYTIDGLSITEQLLRLTERANKPFAERLHPGVPGVLGLRIPDLRALAKRIAKQPDWERYLAEAEAGARSEEEDFMEARILHGLVLGQIPVGALEPYLQHVARWVERINSWSVCDTFSLPRGKRLVAEHGERLWDFFTSYLVREEEYPLRFGIVLLMQYFVDEEHVAELLERYQRVQHEGYYVRMGLAWAIAECYVRCPAVTEPYLAERRFAPWVHNKALQKIRESLRCSPEEKRRLAALRVPLPKD